MTKKQWLPLGELYKAMREAGCSWSSKWQLRKLEKDGKLRLPRLEYGRQDRVVTREMIEEIVSAFTPGGNGEWYYNED